MRDLKNPLLTKQSIAPAAARNAATNGTGVDLAGYDGARVDFAVGAITDGTHTPKVQESDDNAAWSDVAAGDLIGTLAVLTANTPQSVGYKGAKRYIRSVVTSTGATGAFYASNVVLGFPRHASPAAGDTQTP